MHKYLNEMYQIRSTDTWNHSVKRTGWQNKYEQQKNPQIQPNKIQAYDS